MKINDEKVRVSKAVSILNALFKEAGYIDHNTAHYTARKDAKKIDDFCEYKFDYSISTPPLNYDDISEYRRTTITVTIASKVDVVKMANKIEQCEVANHVEFVFVKEPYEQFTRSR